MKEWLHMIMTRFRALKAYFWLEALTRDAWRKGGGNGAKAGRN